MFVVVNKRFYGLQFAIVGLHVARQPLQFFRINLSQSSKQHIAWRKENRIVVRGAVSVPKPSVALLARMEVGPNK